MIDDFDAYPGVALRTQNNIGGITHVAAPGAGQRIVILSAVFSSSGIGVVVELRNGAQVLTRIDIDAIDTIFDHNPYGWFLLDANTALTLSNGCSSAIKYKVIPA